MGKISEIADAYCSTMSESQKCAFCVGYVQALKVVAIELSSAQEKDIPGLMRTWFCDGLELLQELRELQASKEKAQDDNSNVS